MTDVELYWRTESVQNVDNVELPQFDVVEYRAINKVEVLLTGKLSPCQVESMLFVKCQVSVQLCCQENEETGGYFISVSDLLSLVKSRYGFKKVERVKIRVENLWRKFCCIRRRIFLATSQCKLYFI